MQKTLVLYHKNCPDGFGGAWAAWKKFKNKAEYVAVNPREVPKDTEFAKRDIYVIDNSYPKETQEAWRAEGSTVTVLDHHESAKDDVLAFPGNTFDNDHSGAVIAWAHFHKTPVPLLLKYVEDADLWKWKMPHSAHALNRISTIPFDFGKWDKAAREFASAEGRKKALAAGKAMDEYFRAVVGEAVEKADTVKFGKYEARAANNSIKRLTSEIGNVLAEKHPPVGIVWYVSGGKLNVSLRSNGDADVAALAEKYGGKGE